MCNVICERLVQRLLSTGRLLCISHVARLLRNSVPCFPFVHSLQVLPLRTSSLTQPRAAARAQMSTSGHPTCPALVTWAGLCRRTLAQTTLRTLGRPLMRTPPVSPLAYHSGAPHAYVCNWPTLAKTRDIGFVASVPVCLPVRKAVHKSHDLGMWV